MSKDECDSSQMMGGFFFAAAAAVAVFAILIIAAPCADADPSYHGTCGDVTYDFDADSGTMYIGGEGAMDHRGFSYPWKEYDSAIRTVVIGDGVTGIGNMAFFLLDNLETVTIGKNVKTLGYGTFMSDYKLRVINYNAIEADDCEMESGGFVPFNGCGSKVGLTINFSNDVKKIPAGLLITQYPMYVNAVTFGSQIQAISDDLFLLCTFTGTELNIPDNITYIGADAFSSSPNLRTVNMSANVTQIGNKAFYSCSSLTSMHFGADLSLIGDSAFENCGALRYIEFDRTESFSIGSKAFAGCTSLTGIEFTGVGPYSIGSYGFSGCTSLTAIEFTGVGPYSIGDHCFSGCTSLADLIFFGTGDYIIGDYGFSGCTSLIDVELPDGGTHKVGNYAFADCTELSMVVCLNATSIGDGAFRNTDLTVANLPDGLTHLGAGAYENCKSLTKVIVNPELKKMVSSTFKGCTLTIIEFMPGTEPMVIEANTFQCYLVDKEGSPIYDKDDDYNDVTVRGRYFEPFAYKMLKDYETHEWGGDEPIPPVAPVKPVKTETEKELVLSKGQTSMMLSVTDVQAIKDAAANGKTVKIQLAGGTIVLDPKSAANIADGIQTAAIRPADISGISPELKKKIGDHPVFDVRMGENHRFSGAVTVSIDYQLKDGEKADDLVVWHLKDNGTYETYDCTYKDGVLTFTTDHMSDFAVVHSDVSYVTVYAAAGIIALMAIAILVLSHVRKNKA